jgi:4-hydroxybenzoyl-CoA thioesterase/acyl-CoA thioester hydrolase
MGLRAMAENKRYPVVVRTEIDYRKPAALGDILVVRGRLESVERTRFWCAFEIRRRGDDALIVTCRQMLALIEMPPGRIIRLPAEWAERFAHLSPRVVKATSAQPATGDRGIGPGQGE